MIRMSSLKAALTVFFAFGLTLAVFAAKTQKKTDITSSQMSYDYALGAITFEKNVHVVDEQYTLDADRIIVMLDEANEIKQIRAIGHVVMKSGDRKALCPEAVFTKAKNEVVLMGPSDESVQLFNKDDRIWGRKITIWLDSQKMICEPARLNLTDANPANAAGKDKNGDSKRILP